MMLGMLKHKRGIVCLLALLLAISPMMTALASPYDEAANAPYTYNDELLNLLEAEYGKEQAASLYDMIQDIGLIDEDGLIQEYPINWNGELYTLAEMKQMLADEQIDLTQMVEVDGQHISLAALQQIMAIEDELEALREILYSDEVVITPEHLESLESLILQANDEGLVFYDEDGNLLSGEDDGLVRIAQGNDTSFYERENFGDEIYITLTGYERLYTDDSVMPYRFTFELNEVQDKPVSFTYEIIEGALDSSEGTVFSPADRVVFAPGETTAMLTVTPGYVQTGTYEYDVIDKFREHIWAGAARTDYIHFYGFENFDYMLFDIQDRVRAYDGIRIDYTPFSHGYEGGAYVAYNPVIGTGINTTPSHVLPSMLALYKQEHEEPDIKGNPEIIEAHARPGTYTTGQIIPLRLHFSTPILHQTRAGNNMSILDLAGGGIARPEIELPSISDVGRPNNPWGIHDGIWSFGALSFIRGYQTVVEHGMTPDQLKVESANGSASLKFMFDWCDYWYNNIRLASTGSKYYFCHHLAEFMPNGADPDIPKHQPHASDVNPAMLWGGDFTNEPMIDIVPARSDAFASLSLDKATYKVGESIGVTVTLNNDLFEADWIVDGGLTPEDIRKRFIVSIGDREQGLIEMDWVRDEFGEPVKPYVLKGSFEITEETFDFMTYTQTGYSK